MYGNGKGVAQGGDHWKKKKKKIKKIIN